MNNKYIKILKKIANQNGVTVNEVKRDIEVAIDIASRDSAFRGIQVPCKGQTPTVCEFLDYILKLNKQTSHKLSA